MNECEIEDCGRPRYQGRVFCGSHFMRWYRYGDPLWQRPTRSVDLTGQRFGRLAAVRRFDANHWLCKCDCGTERRVRTWCLTSGSTKSCGRHSRRDDVGYFAVHARLAVDFGPAARYSCVDCGETARQWSYSREDADGRQSDHGPYSLDPEHYAPRCVPCHKRMDLAAIRAAV